jgi:hypothetical protein
VHDHRVDLTGGWTAWRWIVLRTAGFPATNISQLAAPQSSRAVDELIALDRRVDDTRERAVLACGRAFDRRTRRHVRAELRTDDVARVRKIEGLAEATELAAAIEARDAQRAVARELLDADRVRISEAIHRLARDARFREALAWQNRSVLDALLAPTLATPVGATDARTRSREATIASYAQRYFVKNDTIGFFGPVGWARFVDDDHVIHIEPGAGLVDVRHVHFEYWGIDTLAEKLAEDPELRLDLAPRRLPTVRIESDVVHYGIGRSARIPPEFLAVLAACDGETSARAIAAAHGDDVYELLGELVEQHLIRWTLEIPTAGQYPERHLRAALERLPRSDAQTRALATLAELEQARDDIACAAGDGERVAQAIGALDERFQALTERDATRHAGAMYAARTLIYEDTRRAITVELGAKFRARIAEPLVLLVQTARWYTHAVAMAYLELATRIIRELRETAGPTIDYLVFLEQIIPHFALQENRASAVHGVLEVLQARWAELLAIPPDARRVERSSAELRAGVAAAFAAPAPGWPQARYQSPDVMVAAAGLDALQAGDFVGVLGEIHTGMQTFTSLFANLHPDPDALVRARSADLGRPLLAIVEPRASALRSDNVNLAGDDIDIEHGDARSWRAPENVLAAAQLVVEEQAGRLVVRTRDGARTFDLVEVLEPHLILASGTHFHFLPPAPRTPRITIDGMIFARESWTFAPADLAFSTLHGLERFAGARRWAQDHGLPRYVFVRVPEETKPCFVDLDSPVYVDTLVRLVRKASVVKVAEMVPLIDQTWLIDAEHRTYTAELRMTLVDPEPWRPT